MSAADSCGTDPSSRKRSSINVRKFAAIMDGCRSAEWKTPISWGTTGSNGLTTTEEPNESAVQGSITETAPPAATTAQIDAFNSASPI